MVADIAVRVCPAMTAAQAVASRVGAPLGHDYAVISLSDRLKPWDVIAPGWPPRPPPTWHGDLQPASRTRTWQVEAMRDLLLDTRSGTPGRDRPDVAGPRKRSGSCARRPGPADVDMRCLLMIGSSQTRWYGAGVHPRRSAAQRRPARRRSARTWKSISTGEH